VREGESERGRPCERQNIPNFVFSRNSKHGIFCIYGIYCFKIKFSQNNHFDSNFNGIYDYNYGMQGPSREREGGGGREREKKCVCVCKRQKLENLIRGKKAFQLINEASLRSSV